MSRFLVGVITIVFMPSVAAAQWSPRVQPGARVRVWMPEQFRQHEGPGKRLLLRGTIDAIASDTLRIVVPGAAGSLAIPRSQIKRLEISRGHPRRVPSAFQRAVEGAIAGAIEIALQNDPYGKEWPHYKRDWRAAEEGAKWGAAMGAVIGLVFPHEQWRRVRLR